MNLISNFDVVNLLLEIMQGETGGLTLLFCSRCALNVDG